MLEELNHFLGKKDILENKLVYNVKSSPHQIKVTEQTPSLVNNKNIPRISIIGGGLAGLTSAYHLYKRGIHAEIYEASERTGGRCLTERNQFDENQHIERGGEFISSSHTSIIKLIEELNLSLVDLIEDQEASTPLFLINHSLYSQEEASQDFFKISQSIRRDFANSPFDFSKQNRIIDNMSISDWISTNIPGGLESKLGQLLNVAYTIENGAECSEQSALNLATLLGSLNGNEFNLHGLADQRYRVHGGNDLIVTKLSHTLSNQLHLNHQLTEIKQNDNHSYTLTFNIGSSVKEINTDIVIIAIPFSILRHVDYSKAGFRPLKDKAIQELGMGNNAKLHYQFKNRFWKLYNCNGTIFSNQNSFQCTYESSREQVGTSGILFQLLGGNSVDQFLNKDGVINHYQTLIHKLESTFPGSSDSFNGRFTIDKWKDNEWTRGSYSYRKVGQFTKFMSVPQEKEGHCHFAGEHTSIKYASYMNGAVESGIRAANEIIENIIK
ncbi:flavin monoamine oxidase family protein [Litchfieldia salsa]